MSRVMVRSARDDLEALLTANAMEEAGAVVFSVTYDGHRQPYGAMEASAKFTVWAKVPSDDMIGAVDDAINRALDGPPILTCAPTP